MCGMIDSPATTVPVPEPAQLGQFLMGPPRLLDDHAGAPMKPLAGRRQHHATGIALEQRRAQLPL